MIRLDRGKIGKKQGVEVTVRARLLVSPTWEYVFAHKKGIISDEEYIDWYLKLLDSRKDDIYTWATNLPEETTFLCYCQDNTFCHTYLLIQWLIDNFPNDFCRSEFA